MILESLGVSNYKSFLDQQTVRVGPGFNLFVGANNSGKTTMLEALDLVTGNSAPHRSVWSLPNYGDLAQGRSNLQISVKTSVEELRKLQGNSIHIPVPENYF